MQPSATELEQIVRVVMQRLAASRDLMDGVAEIANNSQLASELVIHDSVVTLQTIDQQLEGKNTLRVQPRAIITPAVADVLRSLKIKLVREGQPSVAPRSLQLKPSTSRASTAHVTHHVQTHTIPILVCGSASWFNSLPRHLCAKQATVQACEDGSAVTVIERHLASGGSHAVWLSNTPFAAMVAASRSSRAAAVQLPSLRELAEALSQAQPQVLIIDASQWTVAAVGNLVRTLVRSH